VTTSPRLAFASAANMNGQFLPFIYHPEFCMCVQIAKAGVGLVVGETP